MQDKTKLEWEVSPLRELIRLAWPICVSMLSYSAMTVVDTAFVGHLGASALAGVGLAGTMGFAAMVFGIGLLRGVKVVVSQAIGAGKPERVAELAAAGLWIALTMGIFVLFVGQFLVLAVPPLAASELAGQIGSEYLFIRLLTAPIFYIASTTRQTSYGLGDTRGPMVGTVIANIVNIALDYVFIIHWQMGAQGAAWATLVATFIEAGLILWVAKGIGLGSLRKGRRWLRSILRIGIATGIQFAVEIGAFTLLTILISAMSENDMAGHQVALCVLHFAFLPILAVGEAGSVMAGQAVGGDRDELISKIARYTTGLSLGYALLGTLVLGFGASQIASLFGDDLEVQKVATELLYLAAVFQVGDAFNITARSILRGIGDVRFPAIVGVGVSWMALPPLTWILGYVLNWGALGAWTAIAVEVFVAAIILWWRLLGGGWRKSAEQSRRAIGRYT